MNPKNINKEKSLVLLLKNGDKKAFDALFKMHQPSLHAFILGIIKVEEETNNIVQDAFIKLWENRKKLDIEKPIKSYLFTISKNQTYDYFRKKIVENKYSDYVIGVSQIFSDEVNNQIIFNELNDIYYQIIENLPPKRKEIFLLSREKGLKNSEIADKLSVNKKTVENHLNLSLREIRDKLSMHLDLVILSLFVDKL